MARAGRPSLPEAPAGASRPFCKRPDGRLIEPYLLCPFISTTLSDFFSPPSSFEGPGPRAREL